VTRRGRSVTNPLGDRLGAKRPQMSWGRPPLAWFLFSVSTKSGQDQKLHVHIARKSPLSISHPECVA
jgi:hypothetical protein